MSDESRSGSMGLQGGGVMNALKIAQIMRFVLQFPLTQHSKGGSQYLKPHIPWVSTFHTGLDGWFRLSQSASRLPQEESDAAETVAVEGRIRGAAENAAKEQEQPRSEARLWSRDRDSGTSLPRGLCVQSLV